MSFVHKSLVRSIKAAALSGAGLGALAVSVPAYAITANTPTNITAQNFNVGFGGQECRISYNANETGVDAESGTADLFRIETRINGNIVHFRNESVAVGTTNGVNFTQFAASNAFTGAPIEIVIRDRDAGGNATNIVSSAFVPNSILVAAGGTCASLVNSPPNVDAGPDVTVNGGQSITFAPQVSDNDGDPVTLLWTQVSGTPATIVAPTSFSPQITAPPRAANDQVLVFQLAGDDGTAASTDTVSVTVRGNEAPNAVATVTPATAVGLSTITLDGSGTTDPEGDAIIYQWVQVSGPNASIASPNSVTTDVVIPAGVTSAQTLEFQLRATDTFDATGTANVTATVAANSPPQTIAGSTLNVGGGSTVTLDASQSIDPDGDALRYDWLQIGGPTVSLNNATTANPTFTAPATTGALQTLTFEVTAIDAQGLAGNTAQQVVNVLANAIPIADAGPDATVTGGSTVALDGSGSTDPEGDAIEYSWVQVSGPAVILSNPVASQPSFTAPTAIASPQTLVFELSTIDSIGRANGLRPSVDQVEITIAANQPPVADAGADQGPINSGDTVALDGSSSVDPDGDFLTYSWVQTGGPSVTLSDPNAANPTFTAPSVTGNDTLEFTLTVSDGQAEATDSVLIEVQAIGSITIIQNISGNDTNVVFTSSLPALAGAIATSGGTGQVSAANVPAGNYTISAGDLTAGGYAFTSITCNDSDSVIDLASRSIDLALSPDEDLVCVFDAVNSRDAAASAINNFLTGRNALLLAHQPDLQRRLDRLEDDPGAPAGQISYDGFSLPGANRLPARLTLSGSTAEFATSYSMLEASVGQARARRRGLDLWAQGFFSDVSLGTQDGRFSVIYAGIDHRLGDDVLIGALVQFDRFSNDGALRAGEAEGDGWMAGPYLTARLASDFYIDLRAAWGGSDNLVSPLGSFTDEFSTNRAYYSGAFIGEFDIGERTVLRPEFAVRLIDEDTKAYTDSLGIAIPSQSVAQGDIAFNPRISHLIDAGGGWSLRPYGEASGIYSFGINSLPLANSLPTTGLAEDFGNLRMRVELGMDAFSQGGVRFSLGGFHDGIGNSVFESTGVNAQVSFSF